MSYLKPFQISLRELLFYLFVASIVAVAGRIGGGKWFLFGCCTLLSAIALRCGFRWAAGTIGAWPKGVAGKFLAVGLSLLFSYALLSLLQLAIVAIGRQQVLTRRIITW